MTLFNLIFYAIFAVLFVLLLAVEKLMKSEKMRAAFKKGALLGASMAFITCVSWKCTVVILIASVITWLCGQQKNKGWQVVGIVILVGILGFYKFADAKNLNILIPIGVSFFTFSAISYLADILKGEAAAKDFIHVALYLAFFPKLISGPLQRAEEFFIYLDMCGKISRKNVCLGLQLYVLGLFKKLVLADRLSIFVNEVFATPAAFSGLSILLAAFSYSLQIYFDFSGYSDMAIGIAKMIGFELPANFNAPYISKNVTEFWRRWHITLSTWIRTYIYIPVGGNRRGKVRQTVNLLVAMTLCGLWHGASVNFILWGFVHGHALLIHKQFMRVKKIERGWADFMSVVLTFAFVSLTWVLFRAESLSKALFMYGRIFSLAEGLNQPYFWSFICLGIFVLSSLAVVLKNGGNSICPALDFSKFSHLTLFFVLLGLLFVLCHTGGSPFIYGAF